MALATEFVPLELENLHREAAIMKAEGWRFIQTHAVNTDNGIDLYYSFMKDGRAVNYRVSGVTPDKAVPSITDLFLAAFVFENEARELFGVNMRDIAIDFAGAMYAPAEQAPMTFISPEQKAALDKARKVAAAKAAKAAAAGKSDDAGTAAPQSAQAQASSGGFVMTPERQARLDAKMATMSPEKKAKVEAALKAKLAGTAKNAAPAAAAAKSSQEASSKPALAAEPMAKSASEKSRDAQLDNLIGMLDDDKASIVRAALDMKGGE